MLKRIFGGGPKEGEPVAQSLIDERKIVLEAIKLADETGIPQSVNIAGQKHIITKDGYGTMIDPVKPE